jgi:hypothetical protein
MMNLLVNNGAASKTSDAGFALINDRHGKQWNFRTHHAGNAFIVTLYLTGGPEFTVKNSTNNYENAEMYLGSGFYVDSNGQVHNASSRSHKENISFRLLH